MSADVGAAATVRRVRADVQFADVVIGTLAASSVVLCRTLARTQMVSEIPGKCH